MVLAEAVWVLSKPLKQRKPVLLDLLRRLFETSNVEIERRDVASAAIASFAAGGGGFSDHLIGAINRHGGCDTTLTFDRKAGPPADFTRLGPKS
jgi:predicted nucleic-acid-binding protein